MSAAVTNVAAWALPFDEFLEMLVDRARSDTLAKAFWDPKKHNGRGGLAYRPLPVVNLNLLLMIRATSAAALTSASTSCSPVRTRHGWRRSTSTITRALCPGPKCVTRHA
jgi:hypothetical protein